MWYADGTTVSMAEGDFGIKLSFTISGISFEQGDSILFTFKNNPNGQTILTKEYTELTENSAELEFTAAESELFTVGTYIYAMDWYKDGVFMCNIIPQAVFKVVDKA